jgi:hypothetical protein
MDIKLIKPYEKNAKKHPKKQVEQVAASIKEFGFNQPLVVDKNNVLIVGHGRLEAAKLLGLKDVPVTVVDLTEEQAKSYRLADNKLNESEWDMALVIEELKGLSEPMLELSGFDSQLVLEGGTDFTLDDSDKGGLEQITFTLTTEQIEYMRQMMDEVSGSEDLDIEQGVSGNENKNGNAIMVIVRKYVSKRD